MIQDPLALAAIVAGITALAFWLDHRFETLSRLGASLLAILLGAVISNLGLVPVASPVYDLIVGPITSLAIVWLLLSVRLSDITRAGPGMLKAYGLAAAGTAAGAFIASLLFAGVFGEDSWRMAGVLTGTFTGGSLNFVSVGRAVELPDQLFAGATAADAMITGLWMGATLMLPVWLGRFYPPLKSDHGDATGPAGDVSAAKSADPAMASVGSDRTVDPDIPPQADADSAPHPFFMKESISTLDLAVLLAVGVALLLVSGFLAQVVPVIPAILWLTTLALAVGHLPGLSRPQGAFPLGTLALHFFFVVIGIFSRWSEIIAVGVEVFWLTLVAVLVHGVVVFGIGRAARLDVGTLSVASQAAVGGPSSALAVAVSREWGSLVLPGVAVGLLGYAVGNYLGVGMALLVKALGIGL